MTRQVLQSLTHEASARPVDLNSSGEKGVDFARRGKILLAGEDPRALETCGSFLRSRGFEVRVCISYAQAVECFDGEDFDFIVVDQGSLSFEGQWVVERALRVDRWKPVVVVTRCHDMRCYLEAMQLGAVDYLEIPVSESDFVRLVESHMPPCVVAA